MKIHHIGIAVESFDKIKNFLTALHIDSDLSETIYDPEQDAELILKNIGSGLGLEFVSGEKVRGLIKRGITLYHICFEVKNLEVEIDRMVQM